MVILVHCYKQHRQYVAHIYHIPSSFIETHTIAINIQLDFMNTNTPSAFILYLVKGTFFVQVCMLLVLNAVNFICGYISQGDH